MSKQPISRRSFAVATTAGLLATSTAGALIAQDNDGQQEPRNQAQDPDPQPEQAPFERDYAAPGFKPSWKNKQINRLMVQDFVIYAHSDLKMTKQLLSKEPGLLNACMDWGNGDWETALGGASHMGRRDIAEFLLASGARIDIFCATMMGLLDSVKAMLTLEPTLIDAKGPHGFSLHLHAQAGQEQAQPVLDYLQSIKELELRPLPFLKRKPKQDG